MIAVCSDKGSPGATVAALALASVWPNPAMVVEADPWGADLPLRIARRDGVLGDTQTVLGLASAAAGARDLNGVAPSADPGLVSSYGQDLSDQVRIVPGPVMAEKARGIGSWASLGAALASSSREVFADFGRITSDSPSVSAAAFARTVIVVCRGAGDHASLHRLRERLITLIPALGIAREQAHLSGTRVVPVVVTTRRRSAGDVGDVQRVLRDTDVEPFVPAIGWVEWDEPTLTRLYSGTSPKKLAKSPLLKSAASVVDLLQPEAARPDLIAEPLVEVVGEAPVIESAPIGEPRRFNWSSTPDEAAR